MLIIPNLLELSLSGTSITELEDNAFEGVSKLLRLDMSDNPFPKILRAATFTSLGELEVLNLTNSKISGIEAGAFATLTSLKELHMSHNLLTHAGPGALPADAFTGLDLLEHLDLSHNPWLGTIVPGLLALPRLRTLLMRQPYFGLLSIQPGALDALPGLRVLDLSGSSLRDLRDDTFSSLSALVLLDLSRNEMERLQAELFADLASLQSLLLADNDILWVEDRAFRGMPELQVLDLSGNFLCDFPSAISPISKSKISVESTRFPALGFGQMAKLRELNLSRNRLSAVRAQWFSGLPSLKKLSIAFNRVSQLEAGTFQAMPELEELDLQGNHYNPHYYDDERHREYEFYWLVASFDGDVEFTRGGNANSFAALEQPRLLEVHERYVAYAAQFTLAGGRAPSFVAEWGPLTLTTKTLEGLSSLKTLRLSHCGLQAVPPGAFDSLVNLTTLHLDWNFIQGVTDDLFAPLAKLQELRLLQRGTPCENLGDECWNPQTCVPRAADASGVIADVEWAMPVCVSGYVTLFVCQGCQFDLHNGTTLVREGECVFCPFMDLADRGISVLADDVFAEVARARRLDLTANQLSSVDAAPFEHLSILQTLILKDNLLTSLAEDSFTGLGKLRLLDLSGNLLSSIAEHAFKPLEKLESLLLGSHRLSHIDMSLLGIRPALINIDLSKYEVYRVWTDSLTMPKGLIFAKTAYLFPAGTQVSWGEGTLLLRELNMQGLGLTSVPAMQSLTALRELDLSGNQLEELTTNSSLGSLHSLRKLQLTGNLIRSVERGAFKGLANVSEISLRANQLERLPDGALSGLDSVMKLDLSGNHFQRFAWEVTWPVYAFQVDVTKQQHPAAAAGAESTLECLPLFPRLLHCRTAQCLASAPMPSEDDSAADFTSLGDVFDDLGSEADGERLELCGFNTFDSCAGCTFYTDSDGVLQRTGECSILCKAFDFAGKGITALDPAVFEGMDFLRMLILSDNSIKSIGNTIFNDCNRLQLLDLSRNAIASVEPNAFGPLRALQHLHLGRNELAEIAAGLLSGLDALEVLDLRENTISSIDPAALDLPALRSLKLSNNAVTFAAVAGGFSKEVVNLFELQLDQNSLGVVSAEAFEHTPNLRFLNLSNSGVTQIEAKAFKSLSELRRLRLDGNTLGSVVEDTFVGMRGLRALEMYEAGVEELSGSALRGVEHLEVLQLQGNAISVIEEGTLSSILEASLVVDLSRNQIEAVETGAFNSEQRFRLLNLTHNQLISLDPGSMPQADEVLVFKGNTIRCLPAFDPATVFIDLEYSRLPSTAPFCLPGACAIPVTTFLKTDGGDSASAPFSSRHGLVLRGIEKATIMMRSDVSTMFDDFHLSLRMYVDVRGGKRQWCAPVVAPYQPRLSNCLFPGYAGNPCRICSANHYCPGTNESIPCPVDHQAPKGSSKLDDCFICVEGEYSLQGNCVPCQEGFFCRDGAKYPCPVNATCAAQAAEPSCNEGYYLDDERSSCLEAAPEVQMAVEIPLTVEEFEAQSAGFKRAVAWAADVTPDKVIIHSVTPAGSDEVDASGGRRSQVGVNVLFGIEVESMEEADDLSHSEEMSIDTLNEGLASQNVVQISAVKAAPKVGMTGSACAAEQGMYCPSGFGVSLVAMTVGIPCPAGYYCAGEMAAPASCELDAKQHLYCPAGNETAAVHLHNTSGIACPEGFFCAGGEAPPASCESSSPAAMEGHYCPAGDSAEASALTSTAGVECPVGSYCAGGESPRVLCTAPQGFCCPAGFAPLANNGTAVASSRRSGSVDTAAGGSGTGSTIDPLAGTICPGGHFCLGNDAGAVPCTAEPGFYCPVGFAPGVSTVEQGLEGKRCAPGLYCPGGDKMAVKLPPICDLLQSCGPLTLSNQSCPARQSTFYRLNRPPPSAALDSDVSSCIRTAEARNDPNPQWLRVDLQRWRVVSSVRFWSDGAPEDFEVLVASTDAPVVYIDEATREVDVDPSFGGAIPSDADVCSYITAVGAGVLEATCARGVLGRFLFIRRRERLQTLQVCEVQAFDHQCLPSSATQPPSCPPGQQPSACDTAVCSGCVPCPPGTFSEREGPDPCTECPGEINQYREKPHSPEGSTSMFQCEGAAQLESSSAFRVLSALFDQTAAAWEIVVAFSLGDRIRRSGLAALFLPHGGAAGVYSPQRFPCRVVASRDPNLDLSHSMAETACCLQDFRESYVTTQIFREFTDSIDLVAANDVCDAPDGSNILANTNLDIVGPEGTIFVDTRGSGFVESIRVDPLGVEEASGHELAKVTIPDSELHLVSRASAAGAPEDGSFSDSRELFVGLLDMLPTGTRVVDSTAQQVALHFTRTQYGAFSAFGNQVDRLTAITHLNARLHRVLQPAGTAGLPSEVLFVEVSFGYDSSLDAPPEGAVVPSTVTVAYGSAGVPGAACDSLASGFRAVASQECGPRNLDWSESAGDACPQVSSAEDHFGRIYIPLQQSAAGSDTVQIEFDLQLVDAGQQSAAMVVSMTVVTTQSITWCQATAGESDLASLVVPSLLVGTVLEEPPLLLQPAGNQAQTRRSGARTLQDGLLTLMLELDETRGETEGLEVFFEDVVVVYANPGSPVDADALLTEAYAPTVSYDAATREARLEVPALLAEACPEEAQTESFFGCARKQVVAGQAVAAADAAYLVGGGEDAGAEDFVEEMLGRRIAGATARALGRMLENDLAEARGLSPANRAAKALWVNPGHRWGVGVAGGAFSLSQQVLVHVLYAVRAGSGGTRRVLLRAAAGEESGARVGGVRFEVEAAGLVEGVMEGAVARAWRLRMEVDANEACLPAASLRIVLEGRIQAALADHSRGVLGVHVVAADGVTCAAEEEDRRDGGGSVAEVEAVIAMAAGEEAFVDWEAVLGAGVGVLTAEPSGPDRVDAAVEGVAEASAGSSWHGAAAGMAAGFAALLVAAAGLMWWRWRRGKRIGVEQGQRQVREQKTSAGAPMRSVISQDAGLVESMLCVRPSNMAYAQLGSSRGSEEWASLDSSRRLERESIERVPPRQSLRGNPYPRGSGGSDEELCLQDLVTVRTRSMHLSRSRQNTSEFGSPLRSLSVEVDANQPDWQADSDSAQHSYDVCL